MRESNTFEKIFCWLKSLFIGNGETKGNSDEIKREMCKRALQSNICPHIDPSEILELPSAHEEGK